ncbi:short-chain dehydrogenase reductase 2a [Phtheirospermum japonicum]|uniref:Short-chain dehydrogenase reductase 2a n=1 Tax=Phtheirospermum japonicum TaxID=374723 RepID=A0A830D7E8_9LAMI|nr:short-chain dehydrogenase reductase 2a [Phtheirospermum japonicum]
MYNNAGVACQTPPSIIDLDLATFDRVMSINVRGVIAGIKHGARVMIPRQKGVILCTASVTGLIGGLAQHTSAASELSKHGIRINCVSPMGYPDSICYG